MWKWIRIPKGLALAAFLLPWMTVSCSNQTFAEASGFGLAFGNISVMGQAADRAGDGAVNPLLILALLAIGAGIFLVFTRGREAAKWVLATSLAALALIFVGTNRYSTSSIRNKIAESERDAMDQAMLAMIRVDWEFGYWLAILSLIAAAAMAWLVMAGKDDEAEARLRAAGADLTQSAKAAAAKAGEAAKSAAAKTDDAAGNPTGKDEPPDTPPKA